MSDPLSIDSLVAQIVAEPVEQWLDPLLRRIAPRQDVALFEWSRGTWVERHQQGAIRVPADVPPGGGRQRQGNLSLYPLLTLPPHLLVVAGEAEAQAEPLLPLLTVALQLERERREREAGEQARDHFFSMVNHDLRGPLASIKAMTDLIDRKISRGRLDPSTEEGRAELLERLAFVGERAKAMATLIDRIGDLAMVVRGRLSLVSRPGDMVSTLRTSVERLEGASGRTFSRTGLDESLQTEHDARQLATLFGLLIQNAIDFSPEESEIHISAARETDQAVIEIVDEGQGIEPEILAQLFTKYGRAIQSGHNGLGIGLYIAGALVEAHGGTIDIDSTPGAGTTVRLTFPLVK